MSVLIVVNNPKDWAFSIPGVDVVAARVYLTEPQYNEKRGLKVFNLARSYRYQSLGYYVSLLAEARGHRPQPDLTTIQDLKLQTIVRAVSDELDQLIQRSLANIQSSEFTLSIYFGRNLAKQYARLSLSLFNLFPAPLLRARFQRQQKWQLQNISLISANEVPEAHHDFVTEVAADYFAGKRARRRKRAETRFDLAILHNPDEAMPPSNARALKKFIKAAERVGLAADLIERDDYGHLAEYDALFIRATTHVTHYTYRFARRAAAEGMVVIDDPGSILKCTNKVYLAELLNRHRIATPRSWILHRRNLEQAADEIRLPCVLKQPDSAFSQGVLKARDSDEFFEQVQALLEKSELVIAQEFLPTPFDWRVGVLNGHVLYVCKYYMAGRHWQIVQRDKSGKTREGKAETLEVEDAPAAVVRTALRAARLIGDGLYGVDLKAIGRRCVVMEINDNPNIDAGVEDAVLGDALYERIMQTFLQRIEVRKAPGGARG